jgi:hypothetical protein
MHFIIATDQNATRLRLVGPFLTHELACAHFSTSDTSGDKPTYAKIDNPNNPGDCPCWQYVCLESAMIPLVAPADAILDW